MVFKKGAWARPVEKVMEHKFTYPHPLHTIYYRQKGQ